MPDYFKSETLINALNTARSRAIRGIVESSALTRQDREILQRTDHIRPIMRGWYHFSTDPHKASEPISPADFFRFLAVYLDNRLGEKWCFSAESSLELLLFPEVIPSRLVVTAMYSSTTLKTFPNKTKLTIYEDAEAYHPGFEQVHGLRLLSLEMAISRLPKGVWYNNNNLITAALAALSSIEDITWRLLQEGRHKTAGRLARALQKTNRIEEANTLIDRMTRAGYPIKAHLLEDPPIYPSTPKVSHSKLTLKSLWDQWENSLGNLMLHHPQDQPPLLHHLARLQSLHVEDTVESLTLSGFHPTPDFILDSIAIPEKNAESAGWPILNGTEKVLSLSHSQPLPGDTDPMTTLACFGYIDAFKAVKRSIIRLLEKEDKGVVIGEDLKGWLHTMIEPTTQGGFIPKDTLDYYRTGAPVKSFAHGYCHPEGISEEMENLNTMIQANDSGINLATMANLSLHWISPWNTGTGRLARFLMNALLAGGGNAWSIIPSYLQTAYAQALQDAIDTGNAGPMAILISNGTARKQY